jgi:hypothetical protein
MFRVELSGSTPAQRVTAIGATLSFAMESAKVGNPYPQLSFHLRGGLSAMGSFSAVPARRRRGRSTSISGPSPRERRGSPLTEVKTFASELDRHLSKPIFALSMEDISGRN